MVLLGLIVWVSCVYLGCCRFVLSVAQPSDWLERLVHEMTYYVLKRNIKLYSIIIIIIIIIIIKFVHKL